MISNEAIAVASFSNATYRFCGSRAGWSGLTPAVSDSHHPRTRPAWTSPSIASSSAMELTP